MIIKINTELCSYRGIPLIVDDEVIGFFEDTPEEIKKVLQALLEDLNDSRKEVEEKEKWIERVLEDEREMQEWLEDEDYWISDDDGEDGGNSK